MLYTKLIDWLMRELLLVTRTTNMLLSTDPSTPPCLTILPSFYSSLSLLLLPHHQSLLLTSLP